jgi:uncharacterized membrane-anchored protein YhcB (DUF1043 family)
MFWIGLAVGLIVGVVIGAIIGIAYCNSEYSKIIMKHLGW